MSLLIRAQRQTLEGLLMRLPNINNAASRNLLLTDLPGDLTRTIEVDAAAGVHVANILKIVNDDAWARLSDGSVPLLIVIENAIDMVRGSSLAAELQKFHDAVQTGADPASTAQAPQRNPAAQSGTATISLAKLDGPQRQQLYNALLSAFPSPSELQQMVDFGLDVNLNQITAAGSLSAMTLELIRWAQAQSRMEDLVKAAVAANRTNSALKAFAQAAGLVP